MSFKTTLLRALRSADMKRAMREEDLLL